MSVNWFVNKVVFMFFVVVVFFLWFLVLCEFRVLECIFGYFSLCWRGSVGP